MFETIAAILCFSGFLYLFRGTIFSLIFGFILLGNGINIVIFGLSNPGINSFPFYSLKGDLLKNVADPIPQALVLTAIVISFALFFYLIALSINLAKNYSIFNFNDMRDEGFDFEKSLDEKGEIEFE